MKSVYTYLTEKNDVEAKVVHDYLVNFASIQDSDLEVKQKSSKIIININNTDIESTVSSVTKALEQIGHEINQADNSETSVSYIGVPLGAEE